MNLVVTLETRQQAAQSCFKALIWISQILPLLRYSHIEYVRCYYNHDCIWLLFTVIMCRVYVYWYIQIIYTTRPKSLSYLGFLVETQLLKPISFSSRRMVRADIFLWPSLDMLVSCWTLFRRVAFTIRFRERLSRVFGTLALPLLPLNDCSSPSFFHWAIVLCTVLSPMAIIWGTSLAGFPAGANL